MGPGGPPLLCSLRVPGSELRAGRLSRVPARAEKAQLQWLCGCELASTVCCGLGQSWVSRWQCRFQCVGCRFRALQRETGLVGGPPPASVSTLLLQQIGSSRPVSLGLLFFWISRSTPHSTHRTSDLGSWSEQAFVLSLYSIDLLHTQERMSIQATRSAKRTGASRIKGFCPATV